MILEIDNISKDSIFSSLTTSHTQAGDTSLYDSILSATKN
jgi:hypothetical protein